MKTIGILGGLGPETTSKIYHSIIDLFRKNKSATYPSIIIYNLPFPFAIEKEAIVEGRNSEKMLPYLVDGAKILEKAGASFGILPCNTLHKYIQEIRNAVKIPFLSILDETVSKLKSMKIHTVGILATETSVRDKLYNSILEKNGINLLYPTKTEQNNLNRIILELINEEKDDIQGQMIEKICSSLRKRGAKSILLACTDIQIATFKSEIPIIDTTEILIQASMRELRKMDFPSSL
ncbi:MAG: amino acid racemase [Candidatus Liptonbacteria bacterium]|nr:amino acid racemase [Candidatus Liptonbacteria bacterium]